MEEIFKPCKQDNKFLIGNYGTLKRTDEKIIKHYKTDIVKGATKDDGYKMYWINGKWEYEHRLVGQHFIPNPDNLPEINHKDGNKLNNYEKNLEWCTHSQNHKHRFEVLGHKMPKGGSHSMLGKQHSDSTKKLMSEAKIGSNHPRFTGYYIINGVKYASMREIDGLFMGKSGKTLADWCKSGKYVQYGLSFEPV